MIRFQWVLGLAAALTFAPEQEKGPTGPREARKVVSTALEKSLGNGGVILKGKLQKKEPRHYGLNFVIDPGTGSDVQGDLVARLGRNGVQHITITKEKWRYDLFCRGSRKAHRLSWTEGGVPILGEVSYDLSKLFQWDQVLKHLGRERDFRELTDSKVDGIPCKVISGSIRNDLLPRPSKSGAEEKDDPYDWEVESIHAVFHIGRDENFVRRLEIEVVRRADGEDSDQDGPEYTNLYTLAVQKYDPSLEVEVPSDLAELLK